MMALVHEGLIVALWLVVPMVTALLAAGLVATVLGWWTGTVDASLASGVRWILVGIALVISAKFGGPRVVTYAHKAFAATERPELSGK